MTGAEPAAGAGKPIFRLDGVQHQYGPRVVLDIDRLDIRRGEALAIIGPSGAGKSTLLRLLQFLEAPSRGRIEFGGREVRGLPALEERRRITTVFQRPLMFDRSVRDNVSYPLALRGARDDRLVDGLLERLGLASLAKEPARTVSAGEAQRVALARALAARPEVLLLDEPTASLDPRNVVLVESVIRETNRQGITLVMTTHLFFQARRLASRTGLLLGGVLVELGPTEDLMESPRDPRTKAFLSGEMVY